MGSAFVPFVNRPFEWEIHGAVNFTTFCSVLRVTWCHRVCFSCYLCTKRGAINVCKLEVLTSHLVQHIRWCAVESEIHAPKFTHKFTLDSEMHETVKFVPVRTKWARSSCEFVRIGPNFVFSLLFVAHIGY